MTLICAKFDANLINISKVTSRKTKWPRFFGLPGRHKSHGSNFGRMPFLLPPMTYKPAGAETRLAGFKSITLTTEPWLILN